MQRKAIFVVLTAIFLSSASVVSAENGKDDVLKESNRKMEKMQTMELKENRDEMKAEIRATREEFKKEIQEYKSERRASEGTKSAELKAAIDTRREEFRTKIATLKDEQKKLTAGKVDTKLTSINEKKTSKMSQALVRLQEILNRLIDKTNVAKAAGADTAAVETAINNAKTAIAAAEAAVSAQEAKTYTAPVTDESTLGSAFSTTLKQLRTDLDTVHATIKAAKTAVRQVAVELAKVEVSVTPVTTVSPTNVVTTTP
jgi:hypothetical protein